MENTLTAQQIEAAAIIKSLGSKQQAVLLWLYRWTLKLESEPDNEVFQSGLKFGLPWIPKHTGNIASSRAVYSRTLRKLEEKGLIERITCASKVQPHTRKLKITVQGREIASQLKTGC